MSTDVEQLVRRIYDESEVPAGEVTLGEVMRVGRRVRTIRRRRRALVGVAATVLLGLGVAQLVVPASGTPLTPLVWAAGQGSPGSEAGAWVQAHGDRFVLTMRDAYLGERSVLVISVVESDGSLREMMSASPVRAEDLPMVGMSVSTHPGVIFGLFPSGARDIEALTPTSSASVSTMNISSPHGGPDYVAVAIATEPGADVTSLTWTDKTNRRWP